MLLKLSTPPIAGGVDGYLALTNLNAPTVNRQLPENTVATPPVDQELESLVQNVDEDRQTIIHCRYVSKSKYINGGWVNIWPSTYLTDADSQEEIEMLFAFQIPLSPNRYYFERAGQVKRFTLLFPGLPKNWKRFHFREHTPTGDGFTVKDILRNNSGVYQIELT